MNMRKTIGVVLAACFLGAASLFAPSATAKTTDESDIWYVRGEAGWAIQLIQNDNTIFATLYVYGPDNQPTWYTATLVYKGSFNWSGDLYKTTGPWFGAVPFDPTTVNLTLVGTMSLNAPFVENGATLIYSVNGVQVLKTIERYLFAYENYNGVFAGVMSQQGTGFAPCNPADNFDATSAMVNISQSTTAMTLVIVTNGDTCSFPGTYNQWGHMGRVTGNYLCTSGASGTFRFLEMNRTFLDFRARTLLTTATGCTLKGYLLGLKQPPVPQ